MSFLESQGPRVQTIEKRVEVPVDKIVYQDKIVTDDRKIHELEDIVNSIRKENMFLKSSIEEWRSKVSYLESQGPRVQTIEKSAKQ